MAQWLLKVNGQLVLRRTARSLKVEGKYDPVKIKKRPIFDALIERRWGAEMKQPMLPVKKIDDEWEEFENYDEQERSISDIEDTVDAHGLLLKQQQAYDKFIHN